MRREVFANRISQAQMTHFCATDTIITFGQVPSDYYQEFWCYQYESSLIFLHFVIDITDFKCGQRSNVYWVSGHFPKTVSFAFPKENSSLKTYEKDCNIFNRKLKLTFNIY